MGIDKDDYWISEAGLVQESFNPEESTAGDQELRGANAIIKATPWRYTWILRKDTRLILPSKSPVNWKYFRVYCGKEHLRTDEFIDNDPVADYRATRSSRSGNPDNLVQSGAP